MTWKKKPKKSESPQVKYLREKRAEEWVNLHRTKKELEEIWKKKFGKDES